MFRRRWRAALLTGVALAIGASAVWAAIPQGNRITGCYKPSNGILRVVESADDCRDVVLSWDQDAEPGPQGPAGPQGQQGPAGPQGPAGAGVAGAHQVFALGRSTSDKRQSVEVRCPDGEVALGGGHNIGFGAERPPVAVQQSLALIGPDGSTPVGWRMEAVEVVDTSEDWRPVVTAVCAPTG